MAPPILYVDLARQFAEERDALMPRIEAVLASGLWVGGAAVEALEAELRDYLGVAGVVALNSGTDALILSMRALGIGPGDEVVTAPNSFIASAGAVAMLGATPVFADVGVDMNIDPDHLARAITPRTKAVIAVHLAGRMAAMDPIMALAERHGLTVIEDAAQAMGSRYKGRLAGTIGHVGCFSAHPLKNFNAMGDAGFIATDNVKVAERVRRLQAHGLVDRNTAVEWGTVSRLDSVQAEILRFRLPRVAAIIERRRANADCYRRVLADCSAVALPVCRPYEYNSFHLFVVQCERRDALQCALAEQGIATGIHYPTPIHCQPAAKALGYGVGSMPEAERQAARSLSLPIHQFLAVADIERVAAAIRGFHEAG